LLVNANSKLQAIPGEPESIFLKHHTEITASVVDAIFHLPKAHREASLTPPASQRISLADATTSGPPAESGAGPFVRSTGAAGSLEGQHHMDLDNHEHDAAEEPYDPDVKFEGPDYDYGSEEDDEDEPDKINGLTFSEMDIVINRVSDGSISDAERAEAAMLMLGMAGSRRRPQPLSPLIDLGR